jgi:hypothetical protein
MTTKITNYSYLYDTPNTINVLNSMLQMTLFFIPTWKAMMLKKNMISSFALAVEQL